jgi:hypothetical protein
VTRIRANDVMFVITDSDGRFVACCGDRPSAERIVKDQPDLGIKQSFVLRSVNNDQLVQRPLGL